MQGEARVVPTNELNRAAVARMLHMATRGEAEAHAVPARQVSAGRRPLGREPVRHFIAVFLQEGAGRERVSGILRPGELRAPSVAVPCIGSIGQGVQMATVVVTLNHLAAGVTVTT
jgi:hypothetical protein